MREVVRGKEHCAEGSGVLDGACAIVTPLHIATWGRTTLAAFRLRRAEKLVGADVPHSDDEEGASRLNDTIRFRYSATPRLETAGEVVPRRADASGDVGCTES